MKKRFWTALVAMFAVCLALAGCGGGGSTSTEPTVDPKEAFVGTWEIVNMVEDGEETTEEDLELIKSLGLNVYLELNEDGTASLELFGEGMDGSWDAAEVGKGSLTIEDQSIPMTLTNDQIVLEQEEASLTFKKIDPSDKVAVAEPSNDGEDDSEDQEYFYGGDTIDDLDDVTELSILVADDDIARISIVACGDYLGDPGFLFEIENKTDGDITVVNAYGSWTVDGTDRNFTVLESLHAGESLGTIGWFDASEVGNDASTITNVKGTLTVFDYSDLSDPIAEYTVEF